MLFELEGVCYCYPRNFMSLLWMSSLCNVMAFQLLARLYIVCGEAR